MITKAERPWLLRLLVGMPLTVALGIGIGLLIAWSAPQFVGLATEAYDEAFPVLRMRGELVDVQADYADLRIRGEKLRGEECRLVKVYAYTVRSDGSRADADALRQDLPQTARPRPAGVYDIGVWRVRPIDAAAVRAQVWTHHSCVGRDVLSLIADVALPPAAGAAP